MLRVVSTPDNSRCVRADSPGEQRSLIRSMVRALRQLLSFANRLGGIYGGVQIAYSIRPEVPGRRVSTVRLHAFVSKTSPRNIASGCRNALLLETTSREERAAKARVSNPINGSLSDLRFRCVLPERQAIISSWGDKIRCMIRTSRVHLKTIAHGP